MPATLSERPPPVVGCAGGGAGTAATLGEVLPTDFPHAGQKAAVSAIWAPQDAQSMMLSLGTFNAHTRATMRVLCLDGGQELFGFPEFRDLYSVRVHPLHALLASRRVAVPKLMKTQ
jgi:hypothetical protein